MPSFESGVFDRRLKEVHEMAACYPNDYDPRGPLASFCGLISDEEPAWKLLMAQAGDETTALCSLLRLLMNRQVMAGVECGSIPLKKSRCWVVNALLAEVVSKGLLALRRMIIEVGEVCGGFQNVAKKEMASALRGTRLCSADGRRP